MGPPERIAHAQQIDGIDARANARRRMHRQLFTTLAIDDSWGGLNQMVMVRSKSERQSMDLARQSRFSDG
jgi:hypothetical protein